MIERITLRLFWTMMLLCASAGLVGIWMKDATPFPHEIFPTFFIIGFASFLIWAPIVAYRFLEKP